MLASHAAFAGLTFGAEKPFVISGKTKQGWPATKTDRVAYNAAKLDLQTQQVAKAGHRLAELLNTIWP